MPRIARLTFGTVEDIWDVLDITELAGKNNHEMHDLIDITDKPEVQIGSCLLPDGAFAPPVID